MVLRTRRFWFQTLFFPVLGGCFLFVHFVVKNKTAAAERLNLTRNSDEITSQPRTLRVRLHLWIFCSVCQRHTEQKIPINGHAVLFEYSEFARYKYS
jgi:ribosomal protein L33